ncbi:pumilio 4 [Actinidia rufa]|uniref:Pumilio 4 n=1 Tax=Actinidia rufa TaxID=165716 RepID=A0A7J0DI49_9ERIC|nr:pumilio 4 [Actinidia rufa]
MFVGSKIDTLTDVTVRRRLEDGLVRGSNSNLEDILQNELELILREQHNRDIINRGRDSNIFRSGSAPPTVEGSLSAMGNLFRNPNFALIDDGGWNADVILSEEEIRLHPAYLLYYYSHENFNACSSLFSMQPSLSVEKGEQDLIELRRAASVNLSRPSSTEWLTRGSDGAIGMPSVELSFADILQASLVVTLQSYVMEWNRQLKPSLPRVQSLGSISHSLASAVAAPLLRSRTPEPQLIRRSPSPGLPPVGNRVCTVEKKNIIGSNDHSGLSSSMTKLSDTASSLSSLSLSKIQLSHEDSIVKSQLQMVLDKPNQLLEMSNGHAQSQSLSFIDKSKAENLTIPTSYVDLTKKNGVVTEQNVANLGLTGQMNFPQTSSTNLYSKMSPSRLERSNMHYQTDKYSGMNSSGHMPNGCSISKKLSTAGSNHLDTASTLTSCRNGQTLRESGKQAGSDFHAQHLDPMWIQYFQEASDCAMHAAASSGDSPQGRNYFVPSRAHEELHEFQKAYLETLFAQQKNQCETTPLPPLRSSGNLNNEYYVNQTFGLRMPYQGNLMAKAVLPSGGSGEDLKNNKTRSFELLDVIDNVVEFNMDQYGSRFIQQKLETATVEEKTKIFTNIMLVL